MNISKQNTIRILWEDFIYSGSDGDKSLLNKRQLFFINSFSFIGFLSVVIFGILNVKNQNYSIGIMEIVGGSTFLINLILLRVSQNIYLSKVLMLFIQSTLLLTQAITGGTEHTGIYWYFTFPITAFFLMGRRKGIFWSIYLAISTLFLLDLSLIHIITISYTF